MLRSWFSHVPCVAGAGGGWRQFLEGIAGGHGDRQGGGEPDSRPACSGWPGDAKENAADRRAVVIEFTAAGRKKAAEINRYSDDKYSELLRLIPAHEHETVVRAVNYLAQAFDKLGCEAMCCAPGKGRKS